jgi:DNA-directed RNA polymerase specialized sigma24 family protein
MAFRIAGFRTSVPTAHSEPRPAPISSESRGIMSLSPDPKDMPGLFKRLAVGDREAFGAIAIHLWGQLRAIARYRLKNKPQLRPIYDEDDAVGSGLGLMWSGIMEGTMRPPDGIDRFLGLARTIIARRIKDQARKLGAAKRDPTLHGDLDWSSGPLGTHVPDDLNLYECGLPPPVVEAAAKDEFRWLRTILIPEEREVVDLRVSGASIAQIAERREKSVRTIERMFEEIRKKWAEAMRED